MSSEFSTGRWSVVIPADAKDKWIVTAVIEPRDADQRQALRRGDELVIRLERQ